MKISQKLSSERVVVLSLIIPLLFALWGSLIAGDRLEGMAHDAVPLAIIGVTSLGMTLFFFGRDGLGIKGGRPMMSGFGFAFVGWVVFLIARFWAIGIGELGSNLLKPYGYLLLFEAICVQLWAFGLVYRAISIWKSPVSASVLSGLAFGVVAYWLFQETPVFLFTALFCLVWGIFYGIIRVRTGSWIGIAIVQSLQSLTAWYIVSAEQPISYNYFYLVVGAFFLFLTWRLLPKYKSDLRL